MKAIYKGLLTFYLLLVVFGVYSQTNIDSLIKLANRATVDTARIKLYGDISWELMAVDINKSLLFAEKQLALSKEVGKDWLIAQAESDMGNVLNRKTEYPNALTHYYNALSIRRKLNQPVKVAGIYSNIATVFMRQNKFKEAIEINFKALKIFEQIGDKGKQSLILGNIGNIYYELEQNEQASVYYQKGLLLARETGDVSSEGNILLNIGGLKVEANQMDSALYYFQVCEKIYKEHSLNYGLGALYNDIGKVYAYKKDFLKALEYYDQGLANRIEFQDEHGIGLSHLNLGEINIHLNHFEKAVSHLEKASEIFSKTNSLINLKQCYLFLAGAHENSGQYAQAVTYYKLFNQYSDSVYQHRVSDQLVEMNTKYETDKKEQENRLLLTQNKLSEETIKQQRMITFFVVAGLVLVASLAFFIFRGLKQQRKANKIISKQKQLVENKNHIIEEKQKEILDSIHYAKRIQNTLLAHRDFVDQNLPDNFLLFKPKDIVSGDFYWATKQGDRFYLAVCDSTGHGVPGAFMSLLNIGFLSEAINEKNILKPNEILDYVRQRLLGSISKEGQKDGFDGILMCFNQSNGQVTYAAAHNAPVLVSDGLMTELPKDKMPVGVGELSHGFKLHSVHAKKGDVLYLYTDGYADQFGGEKGKKFKYRALNELIQNNSTLPLKQQVVLLEETFERWRGNLEQVDDVCIIGIKF